MSKEEKVKGPGKGGAREGAGRKSIDPDMKKTLLSTSVEPYTLDALKQIVDDRNKVRNGSTRKVCRGHIIEEALQQVFSKYF